MPEIQSDVDIRRRLLHGEKHEKTIRRVFLSQALNEQRTTVCLKYFSPHAAISICRKIHLSKSVFATKPWAAASDLWAVHSQLNEFFKLLKLSFAVPILKTSWQYNQLSKQVAPLIKRMMFRHKDFSKAHVLTHRSSVLSPIKTPRLVYYLINIFNIKPSTWCSIYSSHEEWRRREWNFYGIFILKGKILCWSLGEKGTQGFRWELFIGGRI